MELIAQSVIVPDWLAGLLGAVILATIPWAIAVERRLSSMVTKLESISNMKIPPDWFLERVKNDEAKIASLEKRLLKIEHHCFTGNNDG